jgi:hypothetical protein
MSLIRQFSIVIHDVPKAAKPMAQAVLHKLAKKYTIAIEKYNHQEGYHLHLFYQLKSKSSVMAQVRKWQAFKWGRVQADPMRGTFDQANVYVISAEKQKYQDPQPIIYPPISDDRPRCDCGHTPHMRSSLAAFNEYISSGVVRLPFMSRAEYMDFRCVDWEQACWCEKHKTFRSDVGALFPTNFISQEKVNASEESVREENEENVQEESSPFGCVHDSDFDEASECSDSRHSGDSE